MNKLCGKSVGPSGVKRRRMTHFCSPMNLLFLSLFIVFRRPSWMLLRAAQCFALHSHLSSLPLLLGLCFHNSRAQHRSLITRGPFAKPCFTLRPPPSSVVSLSKPKLLHLPFSTIIPHYPSPLLSLPFHLIPP